MNMNYIASSGRIYPLNARILTREANYHTWEFSPQATKLKAGERVSYFRKPAASYKTAFIVRGSATQRRAILTALHDEFENDVRNNQPGRITFGNWYADCFIVSSATAPYSDATHWTENTIEIYVPSGMWFKEETKHFDEIAQSASAYLDYNFDYEYEYMSPTVGSATWITDASFPSEFELKIYGPCNNPRITVNGYPYVVYCTVPAGSTLIINSKDYAVTLDGESVFDLRNKAKSVFEKIPTGTLTLAWGNFTFDLTLFEERSEPKWS